MGVLLSSPVQWDFSLLKHADVLKEYLAPFFLTLVAQFCLVLERPTLQPAWVPRRWSELGW